MGSTSPRGRSLEVKRPDRIEHAPVHLNRIFLKDFRNYVELGVDFAPGVNLLTGLNGHGKTNLLEAVHYACLAHSQRTRKDRELIRWGQDSFVLRLEGVSGGADRSQSVEYRENGEKRVKAGEKESRRLSDLMGPFPLVSFSPDDMDIIRGAPGLRRRFLDVLLCLCSRDYLESLRRYSQALKQRNSLLKQMRRFSGDVLEAFCEPLAHAGGFLTLMRQRLLERFTPPAREFYRSIGGGQEEFSLALSCPYSQARDLEGLRQDLRRKMEENRHQEAIQGTTLAGPHREELLLFLSGKQLREFGSQGQKRSVALSLKLAAARVLEENSGEPPILLLDDVFAELDEKRRARVGAVVTGKGQVFIASPNPAELPFAVDRSFRLENGDLSREALRP